MRHVCLRAYFILSWLASLPALAQQPVTFQFRNDVKIVIDSDTIKNPWAGGLNSPVFSRIDLNQDGTEDLLAFDRTHEKIFTFLAVQEAGQRRWQYAPQYELFFPQDLTGWVLLRDFDGDGKRDIFTKTSLGIKVYRNTTGAGEQLGFAVAAPFITFNNNINLQASSENLPAIVDVDQDGDLDILTFDFSGSSSIEYYQNLQKEQSLPPSSPKFTQVTSRWGGLTRCQHVCHSYMFNGACRTDATQHNDAMALTTLDLDGDGDQDPLIGGELCPNLVRFTNSGTASNAVFRAADLQTSFPVNTTAINFNDFPAAYVEDLDFDNLPDLVAAPFVRSNATNNIDFSRSAWLYRNTGTATVPAFQFIQQNFLQDQMVDAGAQSAPALADVDADGDMDLLLGNQQGVIWFFRNTGNPKKAVFKLESRDYLNLSNAGFTNVRPQFADLNRDGRPDLVLAHNSGTTGGIKYLLNTGGPRQPFAFSLAQIKNLEVGQMVGDNPAFFDLDKDGDQDLIIGSSGNPGGALQFYRNTGTGANPVFTSENNAWGNIAAEFKRRNVFPLVADLNQDGNPELLLGDDTGELRFYRNITDQASEVFTPLTDIMQNFKTQVYGSTRLGGSVTLAAADLDGDGNPEVMAGGMGGGLYLFNQESGRSNSPVDPGVSFKIFPSPTPDGWITIESPEPVIFSVLNVAGQRVKAFGTEFQPIHVANLGDLSPGLYLIQVQTADQRMTGYKFIVQP